MPAAAAARLPPPVLSAPAGAPADCWHPAYRERFPGRRGSRARRRTDRRGDAPPGWPATAAGRQAAAPSWLEAEIGHVHAAVEKPLQDLQDFLEQGRHA